MTQYSLMMGKAPIIWAGIVQGVGLGLIFVPMSALAFATLAPELRTEAAGVFSLGRNIGGSLGISLVETFLTRNIQIQHAALAEQVTPFNRALQLPGIAKYWGMQTLSGISSLDAEVTRQASMMAYVNDFELMMVITLAALPLVIFLRRPSQRPVVVEPAGALE
jgi:DHA2 family multidrug resistance protein